VGAGSLWPSKSKIQTQSQNQASRLVKERLGKRGEKRVICPSCKFTTWSMLNIWHDQDGRISNDHDVKWWKDIKWSWCQVMDSMDHAWLNPKVLDWMKLGWVGLGWGGRGEGEESLKKNKNEHMNFVFDSSVYLKVTLWSCHVVHLELLPREVKSTKFLCFLGKSNFKLLIGSSRIRVLYFRSNTHVCVFFLLLLGAKQTSWRPKKRWRCQWCKGHFLRQKMGNK